jgi:hypothetical protein
VGRLDRAADHWAEMRGASQTFAMFGIESGSEGMLLASLGEVARARAAGLAQIRESTARGQSHLALTAGASSHTPNYGPASSRPPSMLPCR